MLILTIVVSRSMLKGPMSEAAISTKFRPKVSNIYVNVKRALDFLLFLNHSSDSLRLSRRRRKKVFQSTLLWSMQGSES